MLTVMSTVQLVKELVQSGTTPSRDSWSTNARNFYSDGKIPYQVTKVTLTTMYTSATLHTD